MKDYLCHDAWTIIEEGFHPRFNRITESIFSLGNGRLGGRGNFEESYSGDSLQGNYVAGIYYPDKTRVGWWKNGYPEYFAKVLNAAHWSGICLSIDGESLDLAQMNIESFTRVLNMKEGTLGRSFVASFPNGKKVKVSSLRFLSLVRPETGVVRYCVEPLNFDAEISANLFVDFDVQNEDANYGEKFWESCSSAIRNTEGYVIAETRKTGFRVCSGMNYLLFLDHEEQKASTRTTTRPLYVSSAFSIRVKKNSTLTLIKTGVTVSSEYVLKEGLENYAREKMNQAKTIGFDGLLDEQIKAWADKWETSDIVIEGDVAAQQGIRFAIFHLNQTYTGDDERLNIGPKGFTGEKYGGSTYWDTEAFCLPFYLATRKPEVARNLLLYRYKHLPKAIENARKLGFNTGAALYPMVTMNGEECHNEWEITFEEIHRNGAIAYAIYDYIRYTGNRDYLAPFGMEVLLAISRFWAQRVNWSEAKKAWVLLGVTGPNEYENNVNNNWHTNNIAVWTLRYTLESIGWMKENHLPVWLALAEKVHFDEEKEIHRWKGIIEKMYYPWDEERQIFLQQDGFLDKERSTVEDIAPGERPISQHWSWDRILRSPYIKQADVLQSLYLFEDQYDKAFISRHFDFYEPLTVHESSLSSCVHSILAAATGKEDKAYDLYLRTARLDLDDYNNDTCDGLHITSMGGTWMALVKGFGGMRVHNNTLCFDPMLPESWKSFSFRINFRGHTVRVKVCSGHVEISLQTDRYLTVSVYGKSVTLIKNQCTIIPSIR